MRGYDPLFVKAARDSPVVLFPSALAYQRPLVSTVLLQVLMGLQLFSGYRAFSLAFRGNSQRVEREGAEFQGKEAAFPCSVKCLFAEHPL